MSLDPNKTYLEWNGTEFPNSSYAQFKAPSGSAIDWGDGTVERFDTTSASKTTHTYTDGKTEHTIAISGLTNIGDRVFNECANLTSVVISNRVIRIGVQAFSYCRSLTSVMIGNGVKGIDYYAFSSCSRLTIVYYGGTAEEWDKITIGDNNSYLTSATRYYYSETRPAEDGIFWHYVDGEIVFWGCSVGLAYSLKADNSGYIVTGIGTCTDTKIVIPPVYNGLPVVSLAGSAFKGNTNITSVIIPDSVTGIGQDVFSGCTSLTSAKIGNGVTFMGWGMFGGCSKLTNVTIGNNVTTIGDGAFISCKSLTSITIPNGVTTIGTSAFYNCRSLTSIIIPDSVTTISAAAFYNCTSLKIIIIPESVKTLGSSVFQDCSSLKTIALFPKTPPTLGSTDAIPTTISTIYVRQSSKQAYKTATDWTTFASKIVSDNLYLSFARVNQKNKEYINRRILEIAYPVDSIYFSMINTSPADTIGGTWSSLGTYTLSSTATGDSLTIYVWKRLS